MSLAVVRDLREARAPAGPDELAAFETDVLAGFVLARAAAGLSDNTIRSDVLHLEQLRAWFGRLDYVPGISQPPSTYSLTTCDLTSQEPGDHVRSYTHSPTAGRRPDLHDERTVPR